MDIKQEIINYINCEENNGAFLLTGKWGCGKTTIIKNIVEELNKNNYAIANISLFGICDTSELHREIKNKYLEFQSVLLGENARKAYRFLKRLMTDSAKITAAAMPKNATTAISVGVNSINSLDLLSVFSVKNIIKRKDGDKIFVLIFDDFERCDIPKKQLMGLINEYCENRKIKTIIIADEEKIIETEYSEFKEKLISKTIKINPNHEDTIHIIIQKYKTENPNCHSYKEFILDNEAVIKAAYEQSNYNNLRSLKSCIIDFERVYSAWIETDVPTDEMAHVLYAFCAATYEFKNGTYIHFDRYGFGITAKDKTGEEAKDEIKRIKDKYTGDIFSQVLTSLSYWIVNGDWRKEKFVEEIKNRFETDGISKRDKFLNYNFFDLEQTDIDEGLPIVLEEIYKGEMTFDGITVFLQKVNLLKEKRIELPCDVDYSKIKCGLDKHIELIKNGLFDEPKIIHEPRMTYIDKEAEEIANEINSCDTLMFAWKNRRKLISYINNKKDATIYGLKGCFIDCFDDELFELFSKKYERASNARKRELMWVLLDIDFYSLFKDEKSKSCKEKIQKTVINFKRLKQSIININQNVDKIGNLINQTFLEKIDERIEAMKGE